MNDITTRFWLSSKASEVFNISNPEQKTFQPVLAELVNALNPKTLLDYGCGDSFISRLIHKKIQVSLYDINTQQAYKAKSSLKERECTVYEHVTDIPAEHYDCIVFSLVLICLSGKDEFRKVLSDFKRLKKKNGKVLLATTHPCFRQYNFRPFYTEYVADKEFDYFEKFAPFDVILKDNDKDSVKFTDYHWTLEDTVNEIIGTGFQLEKILEVPDKSFDSLPSNKSFPPFIIIIFK